MRKLVGVGLASVAGLVLVGLAVAGLNRNYSVHLTSAQEVATPAVVSDAQGQAIFQLSKDGTSIDYRLNVANIDDVLMAHIHMAPSTANGGIVVWLYPDGPPPQLIPGRSAGTLATGTITAEDLVGALAGQSLASLLEALDTGNAYVNVHTTEYPGGEIRGNF